MTRCEYRGALGLADQTCQERHDSREVAGGGVVEPTKRRSLAAQLVDAPRLFGGGAAGHGPAAIPGGVIVRVSSLHEWATMVVYGTPCRAIRHSRIISTCGSRRTPRSRHDHRLPHRRRGTDGAVDAGLDV